MQNASLAMKCEAENIYELSADFNGAKKLWRKVKCFVCKRIIIKLMNNVEFNERAIRAEKNTSEKMRK